MNKLLTILIPSTLTLTIIVPPTVIAITDKNEYHDNHTFILDNVTKEYDNQNAYYDCKCKLLLSGFKSNRWTKYFEVKAINKSLTNVDIFCNIVESQTNDNSFDIEITITNVLRDLTIDFDLEFTNKMNPKSYRFVSTGYSIGCLHNKYWDNNTNEAIIVDNNNVKSICF